MSSQLILIVEENASTRAFLAEQLEADGYEIVLADSRRHALALLASHRPHWCWRTSTGTRSVCSTPCAAARGWPARSTRTRR